jgi:hypothetical protein
VITKEQIEALRPALTVDAPAFYKDEFHFSVAGAAVARYLRSLGVTVNLDGDTGHVTVAQVEING